MASFYAKCPHCHSENQINSPFFNLDMGVNMRCIFCETRFYCNHPESPWKKPKEIIAYTKDEKQ